MVDNFKYFKDVVIDPGEFLYIEIIYRDKDNGGGENILVAQYTINTIERLYKLEPIIKGVCEGTNARAYLHLNPKSYKHVSRVLLNTVREWRDSNGMDPRMECYIQCVCELNSIPEKRRLLLDIDTKEVDYIKYIEDYLKERDINIYKIVPTQSGYHYVVDKINIGDFNNHFPDSFINMNNYNRPILLYKK